MPAKVCPRCGNLYEDLKSKTCPNCFAVLEAIDRDTAQAMARARAEVEQTPEFQAIKEQEDERWRQQSFGACLGVVSIFLVTVVFAAVLIGVAVRHSHHHSLSLVAVTVHQRPSTGPLSPTPAANAALEEVMPAQVGPYERTLREAIPLAGVSTPALHAAYALHGDPLRTVDLFAIPVDRPLVEQDGFLDAVAFAARLQKQAQPPQSFLTQHWRYAILGPAADDFMTTLGSRFRGGENANSPGILFQTPNTVRPL